MIERFRAALTKHMTVHGVRPALILTSPGFFLAPYPAELEADRSLLSIGLVGFWSGVPVIETGLVGTLDSPNWSFM
jgi:hypothetical protein